MNDLVVTKGKKNPRVAIIRTSDTVAFKSCRRKWDFSSHLRQNLGTVQHANPLWLGSAVHFALEDFHAQNRYGSPSRALQAYVMAFDAKYPNKTPDDWRELAKLGCDMMEYYSLWLQNREPLETYVFNGEKQVEVNIKIPVDMKDLKAYDRIKEHYDEVYYSLQLDRTIIDEHGQLWIVEYKTAKIMQSQHFATDPQCTRYVWAANVIYGQKVAGIIYQQHRKQLPAEARVLVNGTISTAANQATTRAKYKEGCIKLYGSIEKVPGVNIEYLNKLAAQENGDQDAFIRRDRVYRNPASSINAAQQILLEASDMLDPNLSIYPNPTRDCPNYCSFLAPCVAMDDGSDYKYMMESMYEPRPAEYDEWRTELPNPETFKGIKL